MVEGNKALLRVEESVLLNILFQNGKGGVHLEKCLNKYKKGIFSSLEKYIVFSNSSDFNQLLRFGDISLMTFFKYSLARGM